MKQHRPRIGVVPDIDLVRNRGVDFRRYFLYTEICERLFECDAAPFILPYSQDPQTSQYLLKQMDGLVITGGDFDIHPRYYGEKMEPQIGTLKPERTEFEYRLCQMCLNDGVPLLGICGGLQLINVVFGGSLYQDLKTQRPSHICHSQKHNRKVPAHGVDIVANTKLAGAMGRGALEVNTTHHQAVKKVGQGLLASAVAEDGLVEAVEAAGHPFLVGVQWHPETLDKVEQSHRHLGVFAALADAAMGER